jgi:hypothetical protein
MGRVGYLRRRWLDLSIILSGLGVSDPLLRNEVTGGRLIIAMADFHYTPNPDGPTQQLLTTLKNLDCTSSYLLS